MENYAYKTIYEDGGWSIVDTSHHSGLYKYSLYFKGDWCESSSSIEHLKETIKNSKEYDKIVNLTKRGDINGLIILERRGGLSLSNQIEVSTSIEFLMNTP